MNKILLYSTLFCGVLSFSSCNDFLDRPPLSQVAPESYFNTTGDLEAFTIGQYGFPSFSQYNLAYITADNHTDNQVAHAPSHGMWVPGEKKVPENGGAFSITAIRKINYFFEQVLPKYEKGMIQGDADLTDHLIGEAYFLRAYNYFTKLKQYGDFPIVTKVLPDESEALTEASKRRPRNEVARFILSDLDKAISLMENKTPYGKNRLTKNVALQFKSRVALYEASWLKYHKGTDRVPGGPEWPGATMDYLADFSIDIDKEIDFFLTEAMSAAKQVAEVVPLVQASETINPPVGQYGKWNPYFEMFSAVDMEPVEEILMWRAYAAEFDITHAVSSYLGNTGKDTGFTRGFIDAFLMRNGLPIYAEGSGYRGDLSMTDLKADRDYRLQLFVPSPTDLAKMDDGSGKVVAYGAPLITGAGSGVPTGYPIRKFVTYDPAQRFSNGVIDYYGCIIFRAVESYLNYIEASYMKNGFIDPTADRYWRTIRRRSNVDEDYKKTIASTDLSKENDWAVYSAGQLVDETLYNIRRERRLELMAEGFRKDDLYRWRALDQVKNYQIEGFNLWGGEIEKLYENSYGEQEKLIPYGTPGKIANVSSKEISGSYLRPYQITKNNNLVWEGYTWCPANYLEPIPFREFVLTSTTPGDVTTSVIYQNPGWPVASGAPAIGY